MASSRDYWKKREAEALNNRIKDEKAYNAEIHKIYQNMINAANNEINAFYAKYAKAEGISLAEAKKRIDSGDIEKYSKKAKQYVKDREFSDKANEEMRLYNAMMSINRMEMLKSSIGLGMVDGFDQMDKAMKENLMNSAMKEFERQAGILGETVIAARESAQAIVDSSFHNATFSERIWMHQDLLKAKLGVLLQEGLIKGENSGKLSKELTKQFNVSESDALRLMRTELSRVYTEAQKESYIRNGYKEYEIVCEPTACDICLDEEGKHFLVEDMLPGLNAPPFHPNCRCSTSGYENYEAYEAWLDYKDAGGEDGWEKWYSQNGKEYEEKAKNENIKHEISAENKLQRKMYQNRKRDEEQFARYREVLGDLVPNSLDEFQRMKYNNPKEWGTAKHNYRVVNSYEVNSGSMTPQKILQLDDIAFKGKKGLFTGKAKTNSNIAVMEIDGKVYYANSKATEKTDPAYYNFKGEKDQLVLMKPDGEREFTTLVIGHDRKFDTEAKLFEFAADIAKDNKSYTINILSEKCMCESCLGVMDQFKAKYLNVEVNATSSKPERSRNDSRNYWKHRK